MAVKVGINGMGRIGRLILRAMAARPNEFDVVAINDLTDVATLRQLIRFDSVHGRFNGTVDIAGDNLVVNGKEIEVMAERAPAKLPWRALGVEVAAECTGAFTKRSSEKGGYGDHLEAGARKVIISAPTKDDPDLMLVQGVNDDQLNASHQCISNASCTTNCLAPIVKVLHDSFGIVEGLMTTVHAYTNDQRVLDLVHSDLRRARSAAVNIIPTTTGAARAVGKVMPELNGKLNGMAVRVPVADGSLVDFVVTLKKSVTAAEVNAAIKTAAETKMKGILEYSEDPLVSSDIVGNSHSSVFDARSTLTMPVSGGKLVKVISWYDNEWGYSCRTVDLIAKVAAL